MVMDGYGLFLFGVFIIFEFVFTILGLTPAPEMPNVQSRSTAGPPHLAPAPTAHHPTKITVRDFALLRQVETVKYSI